MSDDPVKTKDAVALTEGLIGDDPSLLAMVAEETLNARVAQLIYEARTRAGLTQQQLARLIGTSQSVIARLEDADYTGHSLSMLQRIAGALDLRLDVSFRRPRQRFAKRRPVAATPTSPTA